MKFWARRVNSLFDRICCSMDHDREKGNSPVWPHSYRAVKPVKLDHYLLSEALHRPESPWGTAGHR